MRVLIGANGTANISYWEQFYHSPTSVERRWGYAASLRNSLVTAVAWWPFLSPSHLILVAMASGGIALFSNRFQHSLRQFFQSHVGKAPLFNFICYYGKRLGYTLCAGLIVMSAAHLFEIFSLPILVHLIVSRFCTSSIFVVNYYEDKLIAKNISTRDTNAHSIGIFSLVRAFFKQLDLSGGMLFGFRPFWLDLILTGVLLSSYGVRHLWVVCQPLSLQVDGHYLKESTSSNCRG